MFIKRNRGSLKFLRIVALFIFSLHFVSSTQAQSKKCSCKYSEEQISQLPITDLVKEYKRLKRGHCEDFRSNMFSIMEEIRTRLDGKSKSEIRKTLGKPDEVKGTRWIYRWRDHDHLFFDFEGDIAKARWYHAWE